MKSAILVLLMVGLSAMHIVGQTGDSATRALTDAAMRGELEKVKELLASGVPVNAETTGHKGWTALMSAATFGRTEVVVFLIANGASVHARLKDGETPLIQAAQSDNNREIVEALIKAGAEIDAKTKEGLTALMRFAWMGHREAVKLLLDAGADATLKDKKGWTAFFFACSHGNDKEIVEYLLKHKSDPNEIGPDGITPLMWKGWGDRSRNFEALIAAGADVNFQAKDGVTPLMISSQRFFIDEVKLLLGAKANVNAKDQRGWTALMWLSASRFRSDEIGAHGDGMIVWLTATSLIERLVAAGALINEQNKDGDTALILAFKNRNAHFAEQLLKLGADPDLRNKKGLTAASFRDRFSKDEHDALLRLADRVRTRVGN